MRGTKVNQLTSYALRSLLAALPAVVISCHTLSSDSDAPRAFASPQAAGDALAQALKTDDRSDLTAILGQGAESLLSSGDPVDDQAQRERFEAAYELKHAWTHWNKGGAVLEIGKDAWPFPIPLVEGSRGWHFDLQQGADEILDRRVGRNELYTIQACLAFVDAEREYFERNPRGIARPEYARYILSREGEKDGLYWKTSEGEAPSPLGPIYAAARSQGYSPTRGGGKPFHGYMYRVLHAQGASAPGGAYDYIQDGEMTGGFGLLAWPAKYDASGVMTFLVNHIGVVYEKDLGPQTEEIVTTLTVFNPDDTWDLVSESARVLPES